MQENFNFNCHLALTPSLTGGEAGRGRGEGVWGAERGPSGRAGLSFRAPIITQWAHKTRRVKNTERAKSRAVGAEVRIVFGRDPPEGGIRRHETILHRLPCSTQHAVITGENKGDVR